MHRARFVLLPAPGFMRDPRIAVVVEPSGRRRSLIRGVLRELGVRTVFVDAMNALGSLLRFFSTAVLLLDFHEADAHQDEVLDALALAPQRPPAIVIGARPGLPGVAGRMGLVMMEAQYERAHLLETLRRALGLTPAPAA
jgi:CheY-like chemotaxis protein